MSESQYPSTGVPDAAPPIAPTPVAAPAAALTPPPGWAQPQAAETGWGQPAPAQSGWVMPAAVAQAPGHSMFRVVIAALFMLAAGVITLLPAVGFMVGGSKLSDYLNSEQFSAFGDAVGGVLAAVGVVMLVWALLEILSSLGMFLRRTWGRALGTVVGLVGGLFMTLILFGSLGALRAADSAAPTGAGGTVFVVIVAAVFAGYWVTFFACLTGGAHFRRG